jgi:CTP synthase (UTP-ammonia lyase)
MLVAGTQAATLYNADNAVEDYWCNYGVNPEYVKSLTQAGLTISGVGEDGEMRIVELTGHAFYVATLFLPQKRSMPGRPHPVLAGFATAVTDGGGRRSA